MIDTNKYKIKCNIHDIYSFADILTYIVSLYKKYWKTKKINLLEQLCYPNLHGVSYNHLSHVSTIYIHDVTLYTKKSIKLFITLKIHVIHNIQYLVLDQPSPNFKPQNILCHIKLLVFTTQFKLFYKSYNLYSCYYTHI